MNGHVGDLWMTLRWRRAVAAAAAMACATFAAVSAARGELIVSGGALEVGCFNPFGHSFQHINQLANPMTETRTVVLHNSAAQAEYQFNWNLLSGHFHIDANLASEGGTGGPFCATDNRVNFQITQDTLLSIDSEWTYQFNGGIRRSRIIFWVGDLATNSSFWFISDASDTLAGDPPTDTFFLGGSLLLTPGSYFVRSLMDLSAVGGSQNSVSTAHGFADITLTTVPEPAGLVMVAIGGVFVGRRRRVAR